MYDGEIKFFIINLLWVFFFSIVALIKILRHWFKLRKFCLTIENTQAWNDQWIKKFFYIKRAYFSIALYTTDSLWAWDSQSDLRWLFAKPLVGNNGSAHKACLLIYKLLIFPFFSNQIFFFNIFDTKILRKRTQQNVYDLLWRDTTYFAVACF